MNRKPSINLESLLEDIECIFTGAIGSGNYSCALKAKEMQAKLLGYFPSSKKQPVSFTTLLASLTDAAVEEILRDMPRDAAEEKVL